MEPKLRFRLNGEIMTEIDIRYVIVEGCPTGDREIAVKDDALGWFTIDDNRNLWDDSLPKFVLEYRDENIPAEIRRTLPNKGWVRVTTKELLSVLQASGVIQ
jgi:hypothetical protein